MAEEALQDVYVCIWERAAQFEAHRGRALAGIADESAGDGVEKPNNFDHCIGQLNDNTRACLTLAFVEGRSHDEIARLTTNPLGGVKSWIRRGLLSLKECLSSERRTK